MVRRRTLFDNRQDARDFNPGYYYGDKLVVRKCKIQVIDVKRKSVCVR